MAVRPSLLAVVFAGLLLGCSAATDPGPIASRATAGRPTIAATTDVVRSLVTTLAGDDAAVLDLIDRGQVPARTTPSDQRLAQSRAADLVVAVGGGWEPWLADARAPHTLELAPLLNPIPLGGSELSTSTGSTAPSDAIDPRFWLDPDRTTQAVRRITDELVSIGLDRTAVQARADALTRALAQADESAQTALAAVPESRRTLAAPAPGVSYMTDRYGFVIHYGAVVPSDPPVVAIVVDAAAAPTVGTSMPGGAGLPVVVLHLDALAPVDSPADVPSLIAGNAQTLADALA